MSSSKHPPKMPDTRTKSGQHAIVIEYRRKLQSINEHVGGQLSELDQKLTEYLDATPNPDQQR